MLAGLTAFMSTVIKLSAFLFCHNSPRIIFEEKRRLTKMLNFSAELLINRNTNNNFSTHSTMKKAFLLYFLPVALILSACSKKSDSDPNDGTVENTWTFTEGSKVFSGSFVFGTASLNTGLQANNTYTFGMLGAENTSGHLFSIALSLLDLNFTTKNYQSGIDGNDHLNAFYYTETPASIDDIYKSSNLDPGPVMNYTITAYDAANDVVTITFSGQAQLANGTFVAISNGKLKVKIDRL